jgi:iron-sulfur cluster repair protein YtfE (RIC family)
MSLQRRTCRRLHEEHEATLALLHRLGGALAEVRGAAAPDFQQTSWNRLWGDVAQALRFEIGPHFDFEERSLFPVLEEDGEDDLVRLLTEDHETIRAVAASLLELIGRVLAGPLDGASAMSLKRLGVELCERLTDHALKEEQSMLPALEVQLSEEEDARLIGGYAANEPLPPR